MAAGDALTDSEMFGSGGGDALTDEQMNGGGSPEHNGPSRSEALVRGLGQGATLGFRDEIAGALMTLLDKIRGGEDPGYEARRDEARAADDAARQAHSGYFGAGQLGGSVATALVPGVGAGGIVRQGLTMAGIGALDAAGNAKELEDVPAEMVKGAAAGGVAGGAGVLAGRAVGSVAKRFAPGMQRTADAATVRAAGDIGVDTAKKSSQKIAEQAEFLREGKFVSPLDTVGHVSEKLQLARRATNEAYGDALGMVDDVALQRGAEAATHDWDVAQRLRQVAKDALADPATPRGATRVLDDIATELENRNKPMTMRTLDELRRRVAGNVRYQPGVEMPAGAKEVGAQGVASIREHLLQTARRFGGTGDEALGTAVETLLNHSADVTPLAKTAARRATQLAGQTPVHLAGRIGVVAGVGTALANPIAGLGMIAAGFAAKNLEQRGNALIGTGLNKLAKIAANPLTASRLGKWGGYVAAAAQRGPAALAAAHYSASQLDSQYAAAARVAMNEPQASDSGEDEVLPGAPPLDTSTPVSEP